MTLVSVLADPTKKSAVVRDAARLVEDEVEARGGLSGMALKAGYRAVKAVKPGIIEQVLHLLLPEFAPVLDPYVEKGRAEGDLGAHLRKHADAIANGLLGVTDRRAERSSNATLKRAYSTLRGSAQREVAASVPKLAPLIERHVQ